MAIKKYNYVYEITYSDNKKYIGVRSCNCEVENDPYMGSAFHLPEDIAPTGVKTILNTYSTREEAMLEEIRLHAELNVKDNPNYYNQCNSTSTKFQVSEEAQKRSAEARKGRTKETHEYIAKQIEARKKYVGVNRTEAQKAQFTPERMEKQIAKAKSYVGDKQTAKQKAGNIRMGEWNRGRKNPSKGHKGLNNPKSKAWWYTSPDGTTIEVQDSVLNYVEENPDIFTVSSATIMRYLRENKIPKKMANIGWNFGYIAKTGEE